jgi:arylsulfatase A-like enzyme
MRQNPNGQQAFLTTAIPVVGNAASNGAAVWAVYGIVETFVVVMVPLLRNLARFLLPSIIAGNRTLHITSLRLTAIALVIYPLLGAFLNVLIALPVCAAARSRRIPSIDNSAPAWAALGTLTLTVAFSLCALIGGQKSVLPAAAVACALAILGLLSGFRGKTVHRRAISHPVTVVLLLIGVSFIAQKRLFVTPAVRVVAELVFTAVVLLSARWYARTASLKIMRRLRASFPRYLVLTLLSFGVLALTPLSHPALANRPELQPSRTGGARPNIILITLDTVRADHLSLYGYFRDTTPDLSQMAAASATVYSRAMASSNWTLPSHASIFLGQSPRRHGVHRSPAESSIPHGMSPQSVPIAELLLRQGYRTAGFAANAGVLVPEFGFDRGFSSYECNFPDDLSGNNGRPYLLRTWIRNIIAGVRREAVYSDAASINESATTFLRDSSDGDRPFFLFVNYMDAHMPYVPPPPFDTRFPGKDPNFRWSQFASIYDEVTIRRVRPLRDRELRHLTSQYDGSIAYVDSQMQRLFDILRELNLFDNSLIIITADHGEAFGESSMLDHGTSLYQHQVHVPLVIKFPHSTKVGRVDALVSSVDILPTILDAAGVAVPAGVDGQSLLRDSNGPRWISSESYASRGRGFTSVDSRPAELAIFSGSLKRIVGAGGGCEVYDLATDPNETVNLNGRRLLPPEWDQKATAYMDEARHRTSAVPVDPEVLRRLKALGYLR